MKTLFAKTLLFGGLAGSLVLGGCGEKKEFNELEKYNIENKQVYEDCKNFLKEKGKTSNPDLFAYCNRKDERICGVFSNDWLCAYLSEGNFSDKNFNGMSNLDIYIEKGELYFMGDMPLEKQLSVAKEYTNSLKELLHQEKYKNY